MPIQYSIEITGEARPLSPTKQPHDYEFPTPSNEFTFSLQVELVARLACLTLTSYSHFEVKSGCKDSGPDSHFEGGAGCKDSVPNSHFEVLEKAEKDAEEKYKSIHVEKHLELEYDLGTLLAIDINDLDLKTLSSNQDKYLKDLARDNAQLLINKIWELPSERIDEAIVVKLPPPSFILPRENPVPKPKPISKWQKYAQEKGITKKRKSKVTWDEVLKKWVPNYGYKRAEAEKQKDWLIELPGNADPLEDQYAKKMDIKKEKVAKNEFQRLKNLAVSKNIKVPRVGITTAEKLSSEQLGKALTVAKVSTASLGKFQAKLPKEKTAKKVGALLPTVKKRKQPYVTPEQEKKGNIKILDNILNKKPKLDVEKAVNREIFREQQQRSEEKSNQPPRKGRGKKRSGDKKGKGSGKRPGTKPRGGMGARRKPGQTTGRKRR
uniref:Ribosome biogenesis regulatory protein n=1 Tax=Timema shepardi TaxID=629360 RepID=A0A7R9G1G9_TIMSH|nr:unnamed protein product [Timema shepardi]